MPVFWSEKLVFQRLLLLKSNTDNWFSSLLIYKAFHFALQTNKNRGLKGVSGESSLLDNSRIAFCFLFPNKELNLFK